ncbi:uncharacterized protein [Parasteatoda tepidariorum]|uniref:uncharacterized protein n=1 Tax=Parasteatoda tepidariorum TaxID=114398 RepID=UPI001C71B945|nr:uncharacterized protein LOC107456515 [Parasteatoda tepidariorum]
MLSPSNYLTLYSNVRSKEIEKSDTKTEEIKLAIKNIEKVYKPNSKFWVEKFDQKANYDDPAYRCAYLFKYASLHTFLVQDIFTRVLIECSAVMNPIFWSHNNCVNICSLGGGPGIDAIGIISALHRRFGLVCCSTKILELMPGWKDTFDSILGEFRNNHYGLSGNLTPQYFQFSYVEADLLGKMDSVVKKTISSANLITMVKFLSAVTCVDTAQMIRNIFKSMRPGAVVFIIDNAAGGYSELVSEIAKECTLRPIFGPLQYLQYTNAQFNVEDYNSRSCSSTQMTVHLLMKPYLTEWNSSITGMNFPASIPVSPLCWRPPLRRPPYWPPFIPRPPPHFFTDV